MAKENTPWMGWQDDAECAKPKSLMLASKFTQPDGRPSTLVDLYYQTPKDSDTTKRTAIIKSLCDNCKVQSHCLEFALSNREPYGTWGGKTTPERNRILEERNKK